MLSDGPPGATPPRDREHGRTEAIRLENAIFVERHSESLRTVRSALKFSGAAFLALGAAQFLCESSIVASLDEVAFGVFLLDAANTLKRVIAQSSDAPAADELCSALKSIGDTHSIFAWVTSYQVTVLVASVLLGSTRQGVVAHVTDALYASQTYADVAKFAEQHGVVVTCLKVGLAAAALRFGGLRYARTKLAYWSRATLLAANLLADKLGRLLGTDWGLSAADSSTSGSSFFFVGASPLKQPHRRRSGASSAALVSSPPSSYAAAASRDGGGGPSSSFGVLHHHHDGGEGGGASLPRPPSGGLAGSATYEAPPTSFPWAEAPAPGAAAGFAMPRHRTTSSAAPAAANGSVASSGGDFSEGASSSLVWMRRGGARAGVPKNAAKTL